MEVPRIDPRTSLLAHEKGELTPRLVSSVAVRYHNVNGVVETPLMLVKVSTDAIGFDLKGKSPFVYDNLAFPEYRDSYIFKEGDETYTFTLGSGDRSTYLVVSQTGAVMGAILNVKTISPEVINGPLHLSITQ